MKPMTLDEIKAFLDAGNLPVNDTNVVRGGLLKRNDVVQVPYEIHLGWDLAKAHHCDKQWGVFNIDLLNFIKNQNYDEAKLDEVLGSVQMDDSHWRWLEKSLHLRSTEYVWLFLMAEGVPQGACLVFHPKESALATGKLFYIEYIAAAPWNRENPMSPRRFKGVGGLLIKAAMDYASGHLKLGHAFSLHAIPRAVPFYQGIGMLPHAPLNKDRLQYFEMLEAKALQYGARFP